MEGRNVGTGTIGGKSAKQGLISAKDLPIELPEGNYSKIRSIPYTAMRLCDR